MSSTKFLEILPNYSLPLERISPQRFDSLDPLSKRYGSGAAPANIELLLAEFRATLAEKVAQFVEALTHGNLRALKQIALRNDLLFLDAQIVQVLVAVIWLGRLLDRSPAPAGESCQAELEVFAELIGAKSNLQQTIFAPDAVMRATATMQFLVKVFDHLHGKFSFPMLDTERWFRHDCATAGHPPRTDMGETADAAGTIAASLAPLPTFRGAMVIGSFADPAKRDGFNDLDMVCCVLEIPAEDSRVEFFSRLGLTQKPRSDNFEHLRLGNVSTHLSFTLLPDQRRASASLRATGDETTAQIFQAGYAPSGYQMTRGDILLDPYGDLASIRNEFGRYPAALAARIRQMWQPVFTSFAVRMEDARREGDSVHGLIARRYATEVAYRLHFNAHQAYANPLGPKWFEQDASRLPAMDELLRAPFLGE